MDGINYVVYDEHVHHFNWLGDPVYQASATTPAESLSIICGGPKVPKEKEKLWIGSILSRAYQYLDPIVVSLERTFHLSGLQLTKGSRRPRLQVLHSSGAVACRSARLRRWCSITGYGQHRSVPQSWLLGWKRLYEP